MRQSPFLPNRPLKVAVLGSSGAVGSELLKILEQRDSQYQNWFCFHQSGQKEKKLFGKMKN